MSWGCDQRMAVAQLGHAGKDPACVGGSFLTFTPCPAGHRVRDRRSQDQMGPTDGSAAEAFILGAL